jgi:uncharacterized membrane protein
MLIVVPAALIPFTSVLDVMRQATGKQSYGDAAYYSQVGGFLGGIAAGITGAMDYLTIESHTEVKRTANMHALLNIGALALTGASLLRRRQHPQRDGGAMLMSGIAAAGILVSGWFGARLVYEHGVRAPGVSPIADKPELKLPGDGAIHDAFMRQERYVPASGPMLR